MQISSKEYRLPPIKKPLARHHSPLLWKQSRPYRKPAAPWSWKRHWSHRLPTQSFHCLLAESIVLRYQKKKSLIRLALCRLCQKDWTREVNISHCRSSEGELRGLSGFSSGRALISKGSRTQDKAAGPFFSSDAPCSKKGLCILGHRIINHR